MKKVKKVGRSSCYRQVYSCTRKSIAYERKLAEIESSLDESSWIQKCIHNISFPEFPRNERIPFSEDLPCRSRSIQSAAWKLRNNASGECKQSLLTRKSSLNYFPRFYNELVVIYAARAAFSATSPLHFTKMGRTG